MAGKWILEGDTLAKLPEAIRRYLELPRRRNEKKIRSDSSQQQRDLIQEMSSIMFQGILFPSPENNGAGCDVICLVVLVFNVG